MMDLYASWLDILGWGHSYPYWLSGYAILDWYFNFQISAMKGLRGLCALSLHNISNFLAWHGKAKHWKKHPNSWTISKCYILFKIIFFSCVLIEENKLWSGTEPVTKGRTILLMYYIYVFIWAGSSI